MNFRKHWKKILLTTTAFFWASCTSENTAQPLYGVYCPPEGCGDPELSSSSETAASSSSENIAESSSSIQESSSSVEALSSSSQTTSSSSAEVTCVPGDSYAPFESLASLTRNAKKNAEDKARNAGLSKVDSIQNTLQAPSFCLEKLSYELGMSMEFLYGAPYLIHKDEVCSDGTTRPTKEYQEYLKSKEEWEANKPALDEECQKIYEDKLKYYEGKIDSCLNDPNPITRTACELDAMCPVYGTSTTCSYNYRCEDGAECWDSAENTIRCTDENGKSVTYTEEEFKAKYYGKRRYY